VIRARSVVAWLAPSSPALGRRLPVVLAAALGLLLWHGLVAVTDVPALILPAPATVGTTLVSYAPTMASHVTYTGYEVLLGGGLDVGVGVLLALRFRHAVPALFAGVKLSVVRASPPSSSPRAASACCYCRG